ncbi:MAG: GNAT family N-acetyltransferase [Chitinophagales bacterium]
MNSNQILIATAISDNDLLGILRLQQENLPRNISKEEAIEQGFVTVEHSFDVLKRMNEKYQHIIAKVNDEVVGYALVMTKEFRNDIPVLIPMFEKIDQLTYEGKSLSMQNYFVMGQVCIAKNFRGLGIFDLLYEKLEKNLSTQFTLCITEVASRNIRSVKAHERVGFKTIHTYTDPRGEKWKIMAWNW